MKHEVNNQPADPKPRSRPFPWHCVRCRKKTVYRRAMPYTMRVKHDGRLYTLKIPDLKVARCDACGEVVFDNDSDDQITEALRARVHLLGPQQILQGRLDLGLTPRQLAARLGVAEETLGQWEDGLRIQSRALDNLLRVYFADPQARAVLDRIKRNPQLGSKVVREAPAKTRARKRVG